MLKRTYKEEQAMVRTTLRFGLIACLLAVGLLVSAPNANADTFLFTSDHCTGGCGTAPFGTVNVNQNGTTVDVLVTLSAGYSFVKTGAVDFQAFKFNGVGVVLADITVDPHIPALLAATGAFNGNGTGTFTFGINCPSCGGGASDDFTTPISFHVANATVADLTQPNNLGNIFVADVLAPNGNTGPVDVSTPPVSTPEPTTLTLLGVGLFGAGIVVRKRSR
jgi:hypothetical protein